MNIKSDPTLVTEVREYGGFDVNACYQCGSCTVTCNLSSDAAAFPRRIIRYTLIGLRRLLQNSLEPWLCYYCGDCSVSCPRQTEPGEAMMTLRRFLTAHYDWTGLSARIYRSKAWEIVSLSVVGVFVLLLVIYYHLSTVELELSEFLSVPMGMEHMFGKIKTFTLIVFLFPLFILLSNGFRMYWFTVHQDRAVKVPFRMYLTEAKTFILHAVAQIRFRECTDKNRWWLHGLLVFGFVLMFILLVFFLGWFQTDAIYPLYHPQRWLGYLATGALIFATGEILLGRIRKRTELHKFSDLSDWTLPILLLFTAISGIAVHIFRYLEFSLIAHFTYAIHLAIAVPMLVIEIPFGKWSHILYRPLAVYFQTVKEKALQEQLAKGES